MAYLVVGSFGGPMVLNVTTLPQRAVAVLGVAGPAGPPADNGKTMGVVMHGSDPEAPRVSFAVVMWIGSVDPLNKAPFDIWVDTSTT
jgi:hypothetical protein